MRFLFASLAFGGAVTLGFLSASVPETIGLPMVLILNLAVGVLLTIGIEQVVKGIVEEGDKNA